MSKSWQDEHWVKLYTEDDADWLDVPGPARSVFYSLMRRCDKAGRIRLGRAGMKGLAKLIDWPWEMLKPQIDALVLDGCLSMRGDGSEVLLRNFAEAQASRTSDAQRKRMQRERESVSQQVTANHSPSNVVTAGHSESQPVPASPLLSSPLSGVGISKEQSVSNLTDSIPVGNPVPPSVEISTRAREAGLSGDNSRISTSQNQTGESPALALGVISVLRARGGDRIGWGPLTVLAGGIANRDMDLLRKHLDKDYPATPEHVAILADWIREGKGWHWRAGGSLERPGAISIQDLIKNFGQALTEALKWEQDGRQVPQGREQALPKKPKQMECGMDSEYRTFPHRSRPD